MQVVYNDQQLYVVDYPGHDALEVIDKRLGRGMVIRAAAAQRFREELGDVIDAGSDEDAVDVLFEHYGGLLNQPAVYH